MLEFARGTADLSAYRVHYPKMQTAKLTIRSESPADVEALYALVQAAFGRKSEAELLNRLRAEDALLLSHVAELDGEIVGQAAYSLLSVSDAGQTHFFPALGPIAVAPAYQKQGIGGALIGAGLTALQEAGYGLLFLVGHTSYYPRFGFQPALPLGFTSEYVRPGGPHAHFMVAVLDVRLLGVARGHTRFHPAFDET